MSDTEIHVGAVGVSIRPHIVDENGDTIDVSGASTKQVLLEDPDGNVAAKSADFVTDGTDGYIEYVTQANDLDEAGWWRAQGYIVTGSKSFKTQIERFEVKLNLS